MSQKSIARNYGYNFLKTFCGVAFPIITFAYTSRILGADGIGKFNFARSIVSYYAMIALLGVNQYGTREAAMLRDDKTKLSQFAHEILIINGLTTILAYTMLIVSLISVDKLKGYTVLIAINSVSIALQSMGMEWLYQAVEDYEYIAKRTVLFQIVSFIFLVCFVKSVDDIYIYAVINLLSSSGFYVFNFINAKKYILCKYVGPYHFSKHIKGMMKLFAMAVSIELYTVLDSTMLGFICDDNAVGLYTAAIKVNKMTIGLVTALGTVLIPRLSYYIGNGNTLGLRTLIEKGYNFTFLISIPSTIGLYVLSDDIIRLFSGSGYVAAIPTMKILTVIVVIIPFSIMTNNQIFVPMRKENLILISTSVGAVTNFLSNLFFIPRYAENGAAIGTVIAELSVACVCLLSARKNLNISGMFRKQYQYWIAAFLSLIHI